MKRILVFVLFVIFSIGLISCASENSGDTKKAPAANSAGEEPTRDEQNAEPAEGDKMDDDGKSDADKTGTGGKSDADK